MVPASDRATDPAKTSVWLAKGPGRERGRRSGQPDGLGRDKIIEATVRLLDRHGAPSFSMRKLAAELDVTAMSLYWYVETKDDLLELALDSVFEGLELPGPDEREDWRDRLRDLARTYRGLLVRHPWVSGLIGTFLNIGPNSLAFSRAVQEVIGSSGLSPDARMGGLAAVFQFVYGFGTIEGHFVQRCASAGLSQDEYFRRAMGTIGERPELSREFEQATEIMEARGGATVEEMRERDFAFALDLLVAGIEAMVARSK
ncbi:TetR/AcrR family transcriptional regulator [Streptomyces genisteinicus]|uniref:TetR/AcrR family transcriptional regulator n=1 Tax=Streptomyces genisteinicus TaxID=2768068 RepID=A0A7H0HUA4_9ACTN|nr:TetR/AcrR family transcriptional regulator [Streptomyces genisteinicus]QNP64120.1 TetR/AcrR family transcriptional regulator [Streptomyces genisteinicus]